ncbi:hypothetical protein EB231_20190 [Mesorhizobium sp. NZP2298]|nr:hypothetical protein EB231_20190 [Mesorhizobium sp. NZP2298]
MVDAAGSQEQSWAVSEAGRLSMASPPQGGLRDAAGIRDLRFATAMSQRTQERSMTPPDSPQGLHVSLEPRQA